MDENEQASQDFENRRWQKVLDRYEETHPDTHLLRVQTAFLQSPGKPPTLGCSSAGFAGGPGLCGAGCGPGRARPPWLVFAVAFWVIMMGKVRRRGHARSEKVWLCDAGG
ncbi:hypothetical protein V7793_07425 [Streptomyces sp. KLMMK]|uniref:hypothetical protein n=1 Tax=Streptomyces sp. KLMMK TaxID=3109353 RepID=UPI002FFF5B72